MDLDIMERAISDLGKQSHFLNKFISSQFE